MSHLPVAWAESAPVADVYERAIITLLAHRAEIDGTGAYPSVMTIARFAVCDEQVIRKRLSALLERGVITYGDQSLAARIPQRYRPKVYDLMIPHEWYSATQMEDVNRQRAQDGLGPYPVAERPPIQKPERSRKQRSDAGCSKPPSVPAGQRRVLPDEQTHLVDGSTSGVSSRSSTPEGYLVDVDRGIYEIPNTVQRENLSRTSSKPSPHAARSATDPPPSEGLFDLDEPAERAGRTNGSSHKQDQELHGGDQLAVLRPDVERLCELLRDLITRNGSKPPVIAKGWRDAARLLLDLDRRPLNEALWLIQWCQNDEFWRANIGSMPTFRKKYDQLRLKARATWTGGASTRVATTDQRVASIQALKATPENSMSHYGGVS